MYCWSLVAASVQVPARRKIDMYQLEDLASPIFRIEIDPFDTPCLLDGTGRITDQFTQGGTDHILS
jgi:hypothetical protein